LVVAFNYAMIGFPLKGRISSLENRSKALITAQIKSGGILKDSDDAFILEILKKEKVSVGKKVALLNCVAASLVILIASWTVFGLIGRKR
jgi:hypothetical protein